MISFLSGETQDRGVRRALVHAKQDYTIRWFFAELLPKDPSKWRSVKYEISYQTFAAFGFGLDVSFVIRFLLALAGVAFADPIEKPPGGSVDRGKTIHGTIVTIQIIVVLNVSGLIIIFWLDNGSSDAVLARLETEKRLALIKAWEESEKSKAENK